MDICLLEIMTGYDINVAAVGGLAVIIGFFLLQLFFRAGSLV